jgi:hypothetical protein
MENSTYIYIFFKFNIQFQHTYKFVVDNFFGILNIYIYMIRLEWYWVTGKIIFQ